MESERRTEGGRGGGCWRRRKWELLFNGHSVFVKEDETVLSIGWLHNTVNVFNATELYTYRLLK